MNSALVFLAIVGCAYATKYNAPCLSTDFPCVKKSIADFIAQNVHGDKEQGTKPIDPVIIPSLVDDHTEKKGYKVVFKNLEVDGFRNLELEAFTVNKVTKTVQYKSNVHLTTKSQFELDFVRPIEKSFTGEFNGSGKAEVTASYAYELQKDEKTGEIHFVPGDVKVECEASEVTEHEDDKLTKELLEDPHFKPLVEEYAENKDYRKEDFCRVVAVAYKVFFDDLKAAAGKVPANAFFSDLA